MTPPARRLLEAACQALPDDEAAACRLGQPQLVRAYRAFGEEFPFSSSARIMFDLKMPDGTWHQLEGTYQLTAARVAWKSRGWQCEGSDGVWPAEWPSDGR